MLKDDLHLSRSSHKRQMHAIIMRNIQPLWSFIDSIKDNIFSKDMLRLINRLNIITVFLSSFLCSAKTENVIVSFLEKMERNRAGAKITHMTKVPQNAATMHCNEDKNRYFRFEKFIKNMDPVQNHGTFSTALINSKILSLPL